MTIGRIPSVEGGIQPTIVDAKGDLIAGVAADSVNRLAVGSNDQVLVADSSTSTGLAWKPYAAQFVAGKNKIINGDFNIWQRGTSFSLSSVPSYTADRWALSWNGSGATRSITRQSFTAGSAPATGYESQYFLRYDQTVAGSGGSGNWLYQPVEDVRTFAGQTVTLSFWAKADSSRSFTILLEQKFGTGGSSTVTTTITPTNLTTSWVRYSYTATLPSVSGKTITSDSQLSVTFQLPANAVQTFDFWGVQLEAGSVATPFTTATGTIQGELAACQRYLPCLTVDGSDVVTGQCYSTTQALISYVFPVQPRVKPTGITVSAAGDFSLRNSTAGFATCTAIAFNSGGPIGGAIVATVASGLTAGNATTFFGNSPGRILWTGCEL